MSVWDLYVGCFTAEFPLIGSGQTPSVGIERCTFDDATGVVRHVESVSELRSPQYLELHPTEPVLYATEAAQPGALVAFSIREDGSLERRSSTPSLGDLAVSVSVHPGTRCAYAANWASGNLVAFSLDGDGMVLDVRPVQQLPQPSGHGPQESNPHLFIPTPDGGAVIAAYAGPRDEVTAYAADGDGVLSPLPVVTIPFPPGSHPRHVAFDRSGNFIYVDGETDSKLHVLEATNGIPRRYLEAYSTVPPGHQGKNRPSELVLHPDGETLYVGNRGADCITVFALDGSGSVRALGYQPSIGRGPRAVRIDPSGQYLLVGNCESGNLMVFEIQDDRLLRQVGPPVAIPSPSSMVFRKALV